MRQAALGQLVDSSNGAGGAEAGGLSVHPYRSTDAAVWDRLVESSVNGTFLHTRRFLSYHEQRFVDRSTLVSRTDGRILGVLPAALDTADSQTVISHPGITYGGLIHDGSLRGGSMLEALRAVTRHYAALGLRRLVYKAVPHIYHRTPAEDDLYALFRLGGALIRRDLSCAIDLAAERTPSERRRRGMQRAQREGVATLAGNERLARFWPVLEANLGARHGLKPGHCLAEIELLAERFPREIELIAALAGERLVGGSVLFHCAMTTHVQYTAATEEGRRMCASDLVAEVAIERATKAGRRFFDFGVSTEHAGTVLNEGLHTFKAQFGGGGVSYDFYALALS